MALPLRAWPIGDEDRPGLPKILGELAAAEPQKPSHSEVARRIGLDPAQFRQIRKGKLPADKMARQWVEAVGADVPDVVTRLRNQALILLTDYIVSSKNPWTMISTLDGIIRELHAQMGPEEETVNRCYPTLLEGGAESTSHGQTTFDL